MNTLTLSEGSLLAKNMDNNLRRRHNPPRTTSSREKDPKHRARKCIFSTQHILSLAIAIIFALILYRTLSVPVERAASTFQYNEAQVQNRGPLAPPKKFDCAIFWLRIPKTASTTITQTFIRPLFHEGNFTNVDLGPNSCITHVGGCAPFWNKRVQGIAMSNNQSNPRRLDAISNQTNVPPFGRKISISTQQHEFNTNQRCFSSRENQLINRQTQCHEYDASTSTINYGHRPVPPGRKKLPTKVQANFNAAQRLTTHVGIDPSLLGWILPPNPMVFSTFRDPLERIFSSFHYGIQFGGGRPGTVGKCDLPGVSGNISKRVEEWEKKVVKTREIATLQNNTTPYQDLLRQYLKVCEVAVDNAYVQFLDPDTKDVNIAIQNLEDYVIVGLQNKMGETLSRWVNITGRSCQSHPHFERMKKVFADIFDSMTAQGEVKKFRESKITLNQADVAHRKLSILHRIGKGNEDSDDEVAKKDHTKSSAGISLASPDFNSLDNDLKEMILRFTKGDQKVWKRVLELFEMQREWGRQ